MGSVTAEFEVRHRWRTTTLFLGRCALKAEHVHARSLQKLHLFDWHFRLGLHFACTCSSKYSVQRWVQRSRINVFSFFSTDWRWQWWRTSNSAVTDPIVWSCLLLFLCTLGCILQSAHVSYVTRATAGSPLQTSALSPLAEAPSHARDRWELRDPCLANDRNLHGRKLMLSIRPPSFPKESCRNCVF